LDFLDEHVEGHGEECNSMVDKREVERFAVDADYGQGCEADDGDVLRSDE
jgi:hypothetical protein